MPTLRVLAPRQAHRLDLLALLRAGLLPQERDAGGDREAGDKPENAAGTIADVEPADARGQRICSTRRHIVEPLRMGEGLCRIDQGQPIRRIRQRPHAELDNPGLWKIAGGEKIEQRDAGGWW